MAEGSRTQLQCGIGNCLNHAPGNIKNSKAREVCRNGTVIKNSKAGEVYRNGTVSSFDSPGCAIIYGQVQSTSRHLAKHPC